jgi:hypothetical protein
MIKKANDDDNNNIKGNVDPITGHQGPRRGVEV